MKAILYSGGELTLEDIEKPVPADDEVLIKVGAASTKREGSEDTWRVNGSRKSSARNRQVLQPE